jgi:hypothetical protein
VKLGGHPKSLDVAMRRIVSAATSRTDPTDGFVDTILAWENMFSDTPETIFKICSAIALLIGPDNIEERLTFYKSLQDLYGKRSTILHGAKELGIRDASRFRDTAMEISLNCMRALYDRDDLLNVASSAERGKRIVLGSLQPDKEPDHEDQVEM